MADCIPGLIFVRPYLGTRFDNRAKATITAHDTSGFRYHSRCRIYVSGTGFYALLASEPEARTAALDPAQADVMVSYGGSSRGSQQLVIPLVGRSPVDGRIGNLFSLPLRLACEEKSQGYSWSSKQCGRAGTESGNTGVRL